MSGTDPPTDDEESTEDLWDELEAFSDDESTPIDADEESTTTDAFDDSSTATDAFDDPEANPPLNEDTAESFEADSHLSETQATPDADEVFDEMDVSAVDGEALWDELAGAEADASAFELDEPGEPSVATESTPADVSGRKTAAESTVEPPSGTETLVDKRVYCQQCPYFTDPPEVACTHEGTSILEVLEDGRFRVRNCPVVTENGPDRTILNDDH